MDFSLTTEYQSKTEPGVSFILRRMGPKERAVMELKLAPQRSELRELQTEREELREKLRNLLAESGTGSDGKPVVADQPALITPQMLSLSGEFTLAELKADSFERANIATEFVQAALLSVKNDGADVPLEKFFIATSDRLFNEIYELIVNGSRLNAEDAKNLQPSTTTSAAAGGSVTNTSAEPAKSEPSTLTETAISTSLAA